MPRIDITITNADGKTATLSQAFEFQSPELPAPIVESISPTSGPIAGGTQVVIKGQHFQEGATVTFGDRPAIVVGVTPTEILAVTPSML